MDQRQIDRVWDIIEKVGIAMGDDAIRARACGRGPLEARPDRAAGVIWFLTDVRSGKDDEVMSSPDVGLVFIDCRDNAYLSITGRAEILRDPRAGRRNLESHRSGLVAGAGRRIRHCACLRIEPKAAELWDGAVELDRCGLRIRQGKADRR